jgi:large subunit ribosomal protein L9
MRVIMRADVDSVGKKGDVVDVSDGYARNYLLPRSLAMKATAGAEAQAQFMRRSRVVKDATERGAAEEVATKLVPTTITITAKSSGAGTKDEPARLFGSVTTSEIADAIKAQTGIEVDRRKLHLDESIRTTGTHQATARLHPDVQFPVTIEVVPA